jgi:hypothetical protein
MHLTLSKVCGSQNRAAQFRSRLLSGNPLSRFPPLGGPPTDNRRRWKMVYQYLTGPRFRHRIEAIVEKFSEMQNDLDKERKTMVRSWAKREEQIRIVIESTAGMYGDLQGIAGKNLQEIVGLDVPLLEAAPPKADCWF